jgi:Na+-translocating ferredoxin:NAD+ oxidoreductase RnfD subunit
MTPSSSTQATAVMRFLRTPKGLLLIVLAILLAIALPAEGLATAGPGLAGAVAAAAALDVVILRIRGGAWEFPSGAILTGLIVAMVLSPHEPWYVTTITSAIAIVSKYIVRMRTANVFNPAALAIVITYYVFHTGQSWWGALGDVPPIALVALFGTGIFIADRVNKMPMVLAFLGTYYLLFTATAFVSDPRWVAEIYRSPDLQAVLFFAFFILTDPPTSPTRYPHQIFCGVLVAVISFALFEWVGAVYYLLAAVLVGNIWEAGRRWSARRPQVRRAGV